MSSTKVLSVLSELDVHISVTKQGIGITISSADDCEASFSEYTWDEVMEDMVEMHSIPVLGKNDVKISQESFDYVRDCTQKMRVAANQAWTRIEDMEVVKTLN